MVALPRTVVIAPLAVLALAIAGGGAAAATHAATHAAKNVGRSVAKNSVTSKSIKNDTVKSKDLKDGSVASVDIADGAVDSAKVKDDTLTGADVAENTLATVPDATAVGGVQVTPLSLSVPSTSAPVPVLSESGSTLSLDCGGSVIIIYGRTASGPPLAFTSVTDPGVSLVDSPAPGESASANLADGHFSVSIVSLSGGSVTAEFTGIYEINASGANDCFYRGTITRTP